MRLDFLRSVYEGKEGCASVYLGASRAGATAPGEVSLRWRAARQTLADGGADEPTLDAVADFVTDPANAAPGLALFAHSGAVDFARPLPAAPRQEIARYAPLPHAMPMLAQVPPKVPHLRVAANRTGGEMVEVPGLDQLPPVRVQGEGWPVHKASIGGWSQARYQRSAEEAWAENAKEFATAVTAAAERTGAELIVLGGDVRARSLLLDQLGRPLRDLVVIVDREVPADSDLLAEAAREEIRRRAERAARDGLESMRTQLAHGRAAEGLSGVVAALRGGQVSDLFIADDPSSNGTLWIGPGGTELALSERELRDLGSAEAVTDRADAALVRALVLTGAELHFIPSGEPAPRDGIAALLRYG
jgi:Bacterial archaeo-eukaryotic release factor family 2